MMELLERFFIQYLEEMGLSYSLKDKIFIVKLDKAHKKLYSQEEDLVCTFDANTAKKKNILLLGVGVFIIDSIIAKYADEITLAKVTIPSNEEDIFELNEKLSTLNETEEYLISEVEGGCSYVYFETNIKSANNNTTLQNAVLVTKDCVLDAKGFEQGVFEDTNDNPKIDDSQIEQAFNFIKQENASAFEEAEDQHYIDMAELKKIQTSHAKTQYEELKRQEKKLVDRIEDARMKSTSAKSFEAKANWLYKMKALKVKRNALIEKNDKKRENIKKLFDKQMLELSARELEAIVDVKVYAQISMKYFRIDYKNKKSYFYFPILKRFIQADS